VLQGKLDKETRDKLISRGQELKEELASVEAQLVQLELAMQAEGQRIPNMTHPDVPRGGEENAAVLRLVGAKHPCGVRWPRARALTACLVTWLVRLCVCLQVGEQPTFQGFTPKDHVTLAEALDMVDFDAAAEVGAPLPQWTCSVVRMFININTSISTVSPSSSQVSGQKFYYLRNAGALLELALVNWAMSRVVAKGFTPIMTPDLVKGSVLEKCGFQPRGEGTQVSE
jgi:seryl-tRNA synthetase